MAITWHGEPVFVSPEGERREVAAVHHLLLEAQASDGEVVREADGADRVEASVPPPLLRLLLAASAHMRHGAAVQVHRLPERMTLEEAAELLREDVKDIQMHLFKGELHSRLEKVEVVDLQDAVSYLQRTERGL